VLCNLKSKIRNCSYVFPVSTISGIGAHEGQSVTIRGWLYNLRESGKLLAPDLPRRSGQIQGVVPKNAVSPEPSMR
jgi:asparaginyl-tRNA synthetase